MDYFPKGFSWQFAGYCGGCKYADVVVKDERVKANDGRVLGSILVTCTHFDACCRAFEKGEGRSDESNPKGY